VQLRPIRTALVTTRNYLVDLLIERGTHSQLMKNKDGLYKEMFDKQAEGYR
jgi:hypothetical protein